MFPEDTSVMTLETHRQFHTSAQAFRELADGLTLYTHEPDPEKLKQIGRQLARIGWNALFTSIVIDEMSEKTQLISGLSEFSSVDQLFHEIDGLMVAANYLRKHVLAIKKELKQEALVGEDIQLALHQLSKRLKELSNECRTI